MSRKKVYQDWLTCSEDKIIPDELEEISCRLFEEMVLVFIKLKKYLSLRLILYGMRIDHHICDLYLEQITQSENQVTSFPKDHETVNGLLFEKAFTAFLSMKSYTVLRMILDQMNIDPSIRSCYHTRITAFEKEWDEHYKEMNEKTEQIRQAKS
jgi:hypothetical protein